MIANTAGQSILDGGVVAVAFLGPPLVVVGDGLSTSDPRWLAMVALAEGVSAPTGRPPAPLVGLAHSLHDVAGLSAGLLRLSRLLEVSASMDYIWSDGQTVSSAEMLCGPVFSAPSSGGVAAAVLASAWQVSGMYLRATHGNLYGIGLMAIGAGDPEGRHGPPVYPLSPTGYAARLTTIAAVWRRGGPSVLESYQTLIDLEATRFGVSRRVHPALVPYVKLS